MSPRLRRAALAVHVVCSVGWVGGAAAYLALGVLAAASSDEAAVRAAWIGMDVVGRWVLAPLAVTSLLTGTGMSLGTPWGLFRHWWVVLALGLTTVATGVLLLHVPAVSETARRARHLDGQELLGLGGDVLHPALGLVVLLVITVLNLYKPRGLTPHGIRAQQRSRWPAASADTLREHTGAP